MQATLHHPAADQHHRDSQSSPTRPTADDNHDHHDDHEDGQRSAPSTRPEAHQREAAVEGLISLSQLPPLMSSPLPSPSPPLRPLPPRKRKSPPLHPPPQQQRQRHQQHQQQQQQQQGARPGQPLLPSDTSQFSPAAAAAAAARAPAFTPAVRSPPPPPPLPALGRVVAPYLTRGGAPTSPPPRPSSTTTTMVTPLLAPLPPLKRLRSIATARPGPGLLAPEAIPSSSTSTSSPTTAPTTTAAPAAIATASSTGTGTSTATAYEAQRSASVAFLDGHHVAPPPPQPPQPSSSPPPSSSSLAPPSRGEEAARHLRGSRRRRRRPRDEDYEDSEYDQDYDYQDDDHDDHEEEEEYDEEEEAPPLMVARVATAPQLPGPAAGFGGGEEEERERRAVERCLDLGVERNVVEALSTAGVSAERIVELILSEDKEQREGIIRGTGLSKNYIMKLQRRALRTSAHLQLPSPLAHSFRSGLVLHVLFDSHDRALFIKKELCRLLNMKGTTFSYWKKKAAVSDIDTSQDFRLMDKCRSIFGGRSTYTLYSAEQMLTILQCMQRSRQKNCFTNVPELTALIASYHPQHHPQQQQPHRFPSSALLPLLPALAGQPHHGSSGLLRAIDAAGDDDDHDDHDHLHEQQQREEEKKKEDEEQEARAEALTAALPLACPAAPDLLSGRTTTPSPPSPAPLTTTSAAAFPGPATDNGHFTAADPR